MALLSNSDNKMVKKQRNSNENSSADTKRRKLNISHSLSKEEKKP